MLGGMYVGMLASPDKDLHLLIDAAACRRIRVRHANSGRDMARSETVVTAFLASPSDVEAERAKLEDVVQELNLTWSKTLGMRLDLLRWETHAYPGVGHDAQDVINQQIGDEYDIFIGIMWGRFGSSTERADSGTEEEFRRARERHEKNPHVRTMF